MKKLINKKSLILLLAIPLVFVVFLFVVWSISNLRQRLSITGNVVGHKIIINTSNSGFEAISSMIIPPDWQMVVSNDYESPFSLGSTNRSISIKKGEYKIEILPFNSGRGRCGTKDMLKNSYVYFKDQEGFEYFREIYTNNGFSNERTVCSNGVSGKGVDNFGVNEAYFGLVKYRVPMESVKSVTVLVMVATGSRYEGQRINGVSHFLEHMIFKGTKKRPSSFAISSTIDGIGGSFNAFTGKEYTGFYVKAAAKHLELVLDVLSDMLLNSLYDQEEFDRERGVIIEEINMHEDDPGSKVGDLFERVLFGGHPLGRKISGEKGNIENLARSDVVNYLSDNYKSQAIVVGLAGNFDKNLVSGYFVRVPKGKENTFEPFKVSQNTPRVTVGYKKTDQANIVLGVPSYFLGHPDRYVLSVLGNILGGTMSSRLFTQVRVKRGLAYTIIAGSEEFHDTGFFAVSAGLRLFSLEEAIKVILGELDLIRAKPVDATELARAKDYFAGRMLLSLEDSYRTAMFYTVQELLEKKVETPEEVLAMVEKVTVEDIQRVAKDIFVNQKLNLAVVGPFKDESKFEKILKL